MSSNVDDNEDDDSSESSGPHPFMGPSFPISKLTNKPFQSPCPWHADGHSGHRLNALLPNSSMTIRRAGHVVNMGIPSFPDLSQASGLEDTQFKRASAADGLASLHQEPAAKKTRAKTMQASATTKPSRKKREKKPLPACLCQRASCATCGRDPCASRTAICGFSTISDDATALR